MKGELSGRAIQINSRDNVAVARDLLRPGEILALNDAEIRVQETIQAGHKVALVDIPQGGTIIRYGERIGHASIPIHRGEWIHTHNVESDSRQTSYEYCVDSRPTEYFAEEQIPKFQGYKRADGTVGTRNYVVVIASVNCSAYVSKQIADAFEDEPPEGDFHGVVALPHTEGCGMDGGEDLATLRRTLVGMMMHPNVSGVLTVGLGCEINNMGEMLQIARPEVAGSERITAALEVQKSGGTLKTVEAGVRKVRELIEHARSCRRSEQSARRILLGLNCGGSDAFSGITANPALGHASDLVVRCGGTTVLPETTEMFGAEHLLVRRAATPEVADKIVAMIQWYEDYLGRWGVVADRNPSPGNKKGGLTNIAEKSLGAIIKGGTTRVEGVLQYAERIRKPGLLLMNTPGYDPVSVTGVVGGGANVFCFTTGRGTGIGNPIVPVIKIATNPYIFEQMNDNMDINAGTILTNEETIERVGERIFSKILAVASGEQTKAEILGHRELVIWKVGPYL